MTDHIKAYKNFMELHSYCQSRNSCNECVFHDIMKNKCFVCRIGEGVVERCQSELKNKIVELEMKK